MSFTDVLNLSICASWLVLAIVTARFLLKKAPKALHCALWALVAIRLLCPVSIESELSLLPSREIIPQSYMTMEPKDEGFQAPARLEIVTNPVYEDTISIPTDTTVDRLQLLDLNATILWLGGMGAMVIYAIYSYLSIRLRVRMAAWRSGRVWECDDIDTPFILGLLRPRIYLPAGLDEITRSHVLAHENAHLKRLDHIWKPLGFALLTVHWFNPVLWIAYILLCRDIELACDERVIKNLEKPQVRAYSEALVRCSVGHRRIAACPLAFGEVGVKGRIQSMLNYKRPGFWIIAAALIVSIVLAVCFLTDPEPSTLKHIREEDGYTITDQTAETVHVTLRRDQLPDDVLNGRLHEFAPGEIVLAQTETTTMYLEGARTSVDRLLLIFNFEHTLPPSGTVLLPYEVRRNARVWTPKVLDEIVTTETGTHYKAAEVRQYGPDLIFSAGIELEVFQGAETISFDLIGMNLLSYRADHLSPGPESQLSLDAVLTENGARITDNHETSVDIMFYTRWLPEGFESGYAFADGELVLTEYENTVLQMTFAGLFDDQYFFDFRFTHTLPQSGTILVPCWATISGMQNTLDLNTTQTHDFNKDIPEGVSLIQEDHENFSLIVDREVYDNLDDYLGVTLTGVYELSYLSEEIDLPFDNLLLPQDQDGEYEKFFITGDLHLMGCEPQTHFPITRDLGRLRQASPENLEIQEKLKRDNRLAWHCEHLGRNTWLLLQENGDMYILTMGADGRPSRQYRLEDSGKTSGYDPEKASIGRSYGLHVTGTFDRPMFTLYSDGSFHFHISHVSSYFAHGSYTLTNKRLVLETADGLYLWTFDVRDNGFVFVAQESSCIQYFKTMKEPTMVHDGERFSSSTLDAYEPPELGQSLEDAVNEAILNANAKSPVTIHAASHKVLAELMVCGVATADGGEPKEAVVLSVYGMYCEGTTDGGSALIEHQKLFPAQLSFDVKDGGYELTEYRELTEEEAEREFPAFARENLRAHRDQYDSALSAACWEQERAQVALLKTRIAEAERLLELIAASPAQYSYPQAYIDAHPDAWQRLLDLDAATVHYAFQNLAKGEELGVKGMLMAIACEEILANWDEDCAVESYSSGGNWFDKFCDHAVNTSDTMSWDELRTKHPGCALAIIHTDQKDDPPM